MSSLNFLITDKNCCSLNSALSSVVTPNPHEIVCHGHCMAIQDDFKVFNFHSCFQFKFLLCLSFGILILLKRWIFFFFFGRLLLCVFMFLFFCQCVTSMLTGLVGQQMNHQIYLNALKMIYHKLFLSKEKFNPFLLLHLKLFVCTEIFFIRRFTKSKNSHDHLQCRSLHRSFVTVISCCLVIFAHCWSSYCFIDNVKM